MSNKMSIQKKLKEQKVVLSKRKEKMKQNKTK
jgi:hypothetical protein